ncbi:MAG: nucleoside monophosphate kinase [Candidatus Colwellbacteria bacterium]|nr:nucleoside monophosphate kinase [Candidatus Colwellbacteria bacterium]
MKAIIVTGPPGAGKGTQATYIADELGLVHYDTGSKLRELIATGQIAEGGHFEGKLNDPAEVREIVKKDVLAIAKSGRGVVLSGSPRTLLEAFGDINNEGLVNLLERLYEKQNVIIFSIEISLEESIERNTKRGEGRFDDKEDVIRLRYKEQYEENIIPTIKVIEEAGFRVIHIDGAPSREEVFADIKKHLSEIV